MFMGHYATALVAAQKTKEAGRPAPFWLLLLASQFLDLLMVAFLWLGLETVEPPLFLDASFAGMRADMLFSHDIVPVLGWTLLFSLGAFALTRSKATALWCAALVVVHEACDLLVGFPHNIMGHGTPVVGLNMYGVAPVAGLLIETALCAGILVWYFKRRSAAGSPASSGLKWGLTLTLIGGTVSTLPMATMSLRDQLSAFF